MGKKATPKKGIKYTFKFRNAGGTHITTLLFEGRNDKGRLEFYNYESKAYTNMRDDRFSYIHRFNLVKEEPVETIIKEVPKEEIIETFEQIGIEDVVCTEEYTKEQINRMRNLSPLQREIIKRRIGRYPEQLADDYEKALSGNEETFQRYLKNGIMKEWFAAQEALLQAVRQ